MNLNFHAMPLHTTLPSASPHTETTQTAKTHPSLLAQQPSPLRAQHWQSNILKFSGRAEDEDHLDHGDMRLVLQTLQPTAGNLFSLQEAFRKMNIMQVKDYNHSDQARHRTFELAYAYIPQDLRTDVDELVHEVSPEDLLRLDASNNPKLYVFDEVADVFFQILQFQTLAGQIMGEEDIFSPETLKQVGNAIQVLLEASDHTMGFNQMLDTIISTLPKRTKLLFKAATGLRSIEDSNTLLGIMAIKFSMYQPWKKTQDTQTIGEFYLGRLIEENKELYKALINPNQRYHEAFDGDTIEDLSAMLDGLSQRIAQLDPNGGQTNLPHIKNLKAQCIEIMERATGYKTVDEDDIFRFLLFKMKGRTIFSYDNERFAKLHSETIPPSISRFSKPKLTNIGAKFVMKPFEALKITQIVKDIEDREKVTTY